MEKGIGSLNMMMADQAARQGIAPAEQRMMMIQKTAADMGRTISDRDAQLFGMGEISFEEAMSRSVAGPGVEETMGQFSEELRRIGKTEKGFSDFSDNIVNLVQSGQMSQEDAQNLLLGNTERFIGSSERGELQPFQGLNMSNSPRTRQGLRDSVIQSRNELQQQQLGFAAGDEVDVNALPKGLKAMYDSGPKGREGVENIAAKTDKFAEGGAVESEIDKGLEELQGVAPEAMVIQQVMTMVMEMIQSGASEEQIVAALKEMGLDEEDIQQVMMMVAEQMQGQESIDGQLAQMM